MRFSVMTRRRWPLGMAVACTLGLSSMTATARAAAPEPLQAAAFFVATDGSVQSFGRTASGSWTSALPVGPPNLAPAAAGSAAARSSRGYLVGFVVGNDGAVYAACPAGIRRVSPTGLASPGTPPAATSVAGRINVIVIDAGGTPNYTDGDDPCGTGFPLWHPIPRPPWTLPGGRLATAGLANGQLGVFVPGRDQALHALWRSASAGWQEQTLTSPGSVNADGGIAAVAYGTGGVSVVYAGTDGRVYVGNPVSGRALNPQPLPPGGPLPFDVQFAMATGQTGVSDVIYADANGAVVDVPSSASGQWRTPVTVAAAGSAAPGGSVGALSFADELDIPICGNNTGRPIRLVVPRPVTGPGVLLPNGPPNIVDLATQESAAQ